MITIENLTEKYRLKINYLDLEIIISRVINKSREFVLTHPEKKISKNQKLRIISRINRRIKHEPLAYIIGHKEFYGLDFKINKNTLIPRPETELVVDETLTELRILLHSKIRSLAIIDIGTGSGNIIISIAKNFDGKINYFATDIFGKTLNIAKQNAKTHNVLKKIKLFKSDLLKNKKLAVELKKFDNLIITANLPYLSKNIYNSSSYGIMKYEPRSALLSSKNGLNHYEEIFKQLKALRRNFLLIIEISPEQKSSVKALIDQYFPKARIKFTKDLSERWRVCKIAI